MGLIIFSRLEIANYQFHKGEPFHPVHPVQGPKQTLYSYPCYLHVSCFFFFLDRTPAQSCGFMRKRSRYCHRSRSSAATSTGNRGTWGRPLLSSILGRQKPRQNMQQSMARNHQKPRSQWWIFLNANNTMGLTIEKLPMALRSYIFPLP